MHVRAIRGVCVGVADHMKAGDVRELDAPLAKYLINIGAVEAYTLPAEPTDAEPARAGKKEKQP